MFGWTPGLAAGAVGVRKAFGHDRRGGGDDQGNGDNELLHESSPLVFGRLISGSAGWPSVPFEHLLGGPCGAVCPIAVGYGVGALGDALRLLKGRATSAGAGTLMIEVTVKWRTRNFAPAPSFNVRYARQGQHAAPAPDDRAAQDRWAWKIAHEHHSFPLEL